MGPTNSARLKINWWFTICLENVTKQSVNKIYIALNLLVSRTHRKQPLTGFGHRIKVERVQQLFLDTIDTRAFGDKSLLIVINVLFPQTRFNSQLSRIICRLWPWNCFLVITLWILRMLFTFLLKINNKRWMFINLLTAGWLKHFISLIVFFL